MFVLVYLRALDGKSRVPSIRPLCVFVFWGYIRLAVFPISLIKRGIMMSNPIGPVLNSFQQLPGIDVWNAPIIPSPSVTPDTIHRHYFPSGRSSWISGVEWDEQTRNLDLTLLSGKSYTYPNIPKSVYDAFLISSSPGSV